MSKLPIIDVNLKTWATPTQARYIDAINANGGYNKAAGALGVGKSTISRSMESLRKSAAIRGYSPEHDWDKPVPDTHVARGVSTFFNKDGEKAGQWVKADLKQEAYNEMVKKALDRFVENVPQLDVPDAPLDPQDAIVPWVQIGDAHIGMLAHAAEVGENFDLKIAQRELN